jgi:citrate lyase subunit beta/citryl-CoA lyase
VPAFDTVYVDFRNSDGFRRECEEACRDGFTGKMAIHPAQVPIINDVFTPSPAALDHARSVIAAFAASPGAGVVGIGARRWRPCARLSSRLPTVPEVRPAHEPSRWQNRFSRRSE